MLKDQLMAESKNIDTAIELDSIFENVELSESVKEQFATVFESAVKTQALKLAESHINSIADRAETLVAEKSTELAEANDAKFTAKADMFFEHLAQEWLVENAVEVDKGIKSNLFDSMFEGMKALFVEHNVVLPAESVDVVAEMEEELAESKQQTSDMFEKLTESRKELTGLKRENVIKEATASLTESQKEKVLELVESVEYNDKFEEKVTKIVEFASIQKSTSNTADKPLTEGQTVVDPAAAEFATTLHTEQPLTESTDVIDPMMAQYIASSTRK